MKKIFIICMMLCIANVCFAHSENNLSAKDEELMSQDVELVKYMKKHKVKIVPAYYHLDSGVVDFYKN